MASLRKFLSFVERRPLAITAERVMIQDYIAVAPGTHMLQALDAVRSYAGDEFTAQMIFIVTGDGCLVGTVFLRDMIFADPNAWIGDLMRWNLRCIHPGSSVREAISLMKRYKVPAIAVVDETTRMLGVVWGNRVLEYLQL